MRVLAIDTSAVASSAAIVEDSTVLAESNLNVKLTHSQTIMPMVESLLDCSLMELSSMDAFAVSAGPGSFTGVRIGISAIKGLAMALDKPCVSISTLKGLACNLLGQPVIACAVMDARRSQVYNGLFSIRGNEISRLCEDRAISIEELFNELCRLDQRIVLVGDGADICAEAFQEKGNRHIETAPSFLKHQKAASIGMLALQKLKKGDTVSADRLMPVYLRLPQAQRELLAKIQIKDDEK